MRLLQISHQLRHAAGWSILRSRSGRLVGKSSVVLGALLVASITPAYAAPKDLNAVIDGIRGFAMGVLFTLTTLYLTVAGIRYVLAGGSPHAMEEAKTAVKNSLLGYALAALAPLLADIVKGIVG